MSFFQNVFDFEFRPTLFGADRQYQMSFKLPANVNRSDYMVSGNAEPFNLSPSENLTIHYAIDVNFVNYANITVDIGGSIVEETSALEVVNALNSNSLFFQLFTAHVYSPGNNAMLPKKVLIKGRNSKAVFRSYIPNLNAEKILQFNKKAPIKELPSLFAKYTIANRFVYSNIGVDRIIELDPEDPYESCLISDAGFNPKDPKPDWQLMQGVNDAFWFYNRTYDEGKVATEIKYPSGAKDGDLSKKTYYSYSGSDLVGVMETPHVLQQSDIMSPPDALNHLFLWGNNDNGQLGDNTITHRSSPVQTVAFGTNWSSVACGTFFTAAVKADGTLWTWGNNTNGKLGDNTIIHRSSPIQTVAFGTTWSKVSCGDSHTAAIKTDGTLWTWGNNTNGKLGDNTIIHRSSPIQTITFGTNWSSVACGTNHTAAIKIDGTLWTWGGNSYGQLGDGTTTDISSPVQTITGGNNWKNVSCGYYHTLALKSDNSLWTCGGNSYGQLGDNTTADNSSPVQIGTGTDWSRIACGNYNSAAIKKDGTLWCWGSNYNGQLGDNTTDNKSSPIQTISQGSKWNSVDGGGYLTIALKY